MSPDARSAPEPGAQSHFQVYNSGGASSNISLGNRMRGEAGRGGAGSSPACCLGPGRLASGREPKQSFPSSSSARQPGLLGPNGVGACSRTRTQTVHVRQMIVCSNFPKSCAGFNSNHWEDRAGLILCVLKTCDSQPTYIRTVHSFLLKKNPEVLLGFYMKLGFFIQV